MKQNKNSSQGHAPPAKPTLMSDAFPSFASRVGASASELAKEALFRPNPGAVVDVLSSAVPDAGKSNSSSGSAGPSSPSMSRQDSTATYPSSSQDGCYNLAHSCLRSGPPSAKIMAANDNLSTFLSLRKQEKFHLHEPENWSRDPSSQPKCSDASLVKRDTTTPLTLAGLTPEELENQEADGELKDGAAVVALLSDPSLCIDYSVDSIVDSEDGSQYERESAKDLPRRGFSDNVQPGNSLSLIPNFLRFSEQPQTDILRQNTKSSAIPGDKADTHVRTTALDEDFEVQPWIELLATYHDEVWGNSLRLVEAARREANVIQNGEDARQGDCSATRRLAMLLGHV
ncbi:MAG: hypothetical protein Q9200_000070 [Gallowayella weberi]